MRLQSAVVSKASQDAQVTDETGTCKIEKQSIVSNNNNHLLLTHQSAKCDTEGGQCLKFRDEVKC